MEFGAHLPLIDLEGRTHSLGELRDFVAVAASSGYRYLCTNDHLLFSRPWLDGLTALAAVIGDSGDDASNDRVPAGDPRAHPDRGRLAALDVLSDGRLIAGIGPGSSARDYTAVGLRFDERWTALRGGGRGAPETPLVR